MTFYSNPKHKQYVLNPRGKALFEDSNRFGTKMMEKMGWSKGKGLGTKLDGNLDFIRVSFKGDQQGFGFVDRDDQWTQHECNFNTLLKSFDNTTDDDATMNSGSNSVADIQSDSVNCKDEVGLLSGKSLEEQSKKSRARVHYQKFTRGKDLSRYNEKDLANIFGKKSLNETAADKNSGSTSEDDKNQDKETSNFGITTIEANVSMTDYFKNKMKNLRADKITEMNDETMCPSVEGFALDTKKKKKRKGSVDQLVDQRIGVDNINPENPFSSKKRKNSNQLNEKIEIIKIQNPFSSKKNSNQLVEKIKIKSTVDVDENQDGERKVKKKTKNRNISVNLLPVQQIEDDDSLKLAENLGNNHQNENNKIVSNEPENKNKCNRIKRKRKPSAVETVEEGNSSQVTVNKDLEIQSNSAEMKNSKKKKKSKKSKMKDLHPQTLIENIMNILQSQNDKDSKLEKPISNTPGANNVHEISQYVGELFRLVDLNGFPNSSLINVMGYSYGHNLQLRVIANNYDRKRLQNLWDDALINKYGETAVSKQERKRKQYSLKNLAKKNMFRGIM